ncbi:MAG TPA: PIN domain-containing protein [Bryobacterales bacterium]|nr:PIN domain-containing protein [Bryobacterales bacterium]
MILADTSLWIDHFRRANLGLLDLLLDGQVLIHPFVVGEISCGNLPNRGRVLYGLQELPSAAVAAHSEVRRLVEEHHLWGRGVGWIDAHLLASALITDCLLWTLDQRLHDAARHLKVEYR